MGSSKPRRQRFMRFNAPLHVRQGFAHAHLTKELKTKLSIKRRSAQIRRGDTVKVVAGDFSGKTGKVNKVSLRSSKAFIEGLTRKNAKGKELMIPIPISKLYITDLDLSDKFRKEKLGIKA